MISVPREYSLSKDLLSHQHTEDPSQNRCFSFLFKNAFIQYILIFPSLESSQILSTSLHSTLGPIVCIFSLPLKKKTSKEQISKQQQHKTMPKQVK